MDRQAVEPGQIPHTDSFNFGLLQSGLQMAVSVISFTHPMSEPQMSVLQVTLAVHVRKYSTWQSHVVRHHYSN